ncbi:MAG: hypothetical protein BA865_14800 [Desulfobacterales bacterium S5133MH4]|nr:MAG: hypothetical protein BA865_14800 [Desulfobacterales bacterium S5133MH4]
MKESRGFKMLNEGYLSCIKERLMNFHKDILRNYFRHRHLGANPIGFLESYLSPRLFTSPVVQMLNLPKIEMVYPLEDSRSMLRGIFDRKEVCRFQIRSHSPQQAARNASAFAIQPLTNTLYGDEGLRNQEKPSTYQSVEAQVEGFPFETGRTTFSVSADLSKSSLPIYKYVPTSMKPSPYKRLEQIRTYLDSEILPAARTTKSILPPFTVAADMLSSLLRIQDRKARSLPENMAVNGTREYRDKRDRKTAFDLRDQWSVPSFPQRGRHSPGLPPEVRPILQPKRSALSMDTPSPMNDTQDTRMGELAPRNERETLSSFKGTDGLSLPPEFVFVDRSDKASTAFQPVKATKGKNSREGVSSHPGGFESSCYTAPVQSSVDCELIADRVYEIIENRLRIEKERE